VPDLIIIAGPNGSGKTTFAKEYLSRDTMRFVFVNADEIARDLALEGGTQSRSELRAGRLMLDRIDELIDAGADLAIETTLASLTYARKIPIWRQRGYNVSLFYLRLNSIAESLDRVQKRVLAGGHNIPPEIIERRFGKSADYLERIYKPIVNSWRVWESREGEFIPASSSEPQ
jgi:predicted ABC-type ATPase